MTISCSLWYAMVHRLCKLQEVPQHLQFNAFILTGYRPPSDFRTCLTSTLQLHNESFNILSHVVALLYFMTGTVDYAPLWNTGDHIMRLFVIVDTAASTVPFALSVTYHTFMPHISGLHTYRRLLKTDVFGVWFTTTFGSLSGIYVAVYCLPPLLRHGYLVMYMLLSLVVLYYVVVVDCKRKRVLGLTVQFFFRSLVQLLRLTSFVTAPLTTFHYYVIVYVVSSVGALINTLHVPECWFPGRCDYVLNGHSMMHVAAFLSVALGKHAMLMDLTWLTDNPNCPVSH